MEPLLVSLLAAAEAAPSDVTLRLHLVQLLVEHGETTEAIRHCGAALAVDPMGEAARARMRELLGAHAPTGRPPHVETRQERPAEARPEFRPEMRPEMRPELRPEMHPDMRTEQRPENRPTPVPRAYEEFRPWNGDQAAGRAPEPAPEPSGATTRPDEASEDQDDEWIERENVTLADIGGMEMAKERLEAAVLAPMRNPELRRLYRQSRAGGVLLYGPPGCGKTFLARAAAGELGARFMWVSFHERSTDEQVQQIRAVFQAAREQAPVVLCLVGIEHLSSPTDPASKRGASTRSVLALATELDKGPEGNPGITILGSANAPWDVDPVLRRPGRLEQTLLVLPPDRVTREVVLRQQLGDHPEVDVPEIARRSSGYSGRDLAAAVRLAESRAVPVTTLDLLAALTEQAPSARAWLERAGRELDAQTDPNAYPGLREYIDARRAPAGMGRSFESPFRS